MVFEKIKLEDDESIVAIVRQHWFVLTMRLLRVAIAALVPPVAIVLLYGSLESSAWDIDAIFATYTPFLLYLYSIWLLGSFMAIAYIVTDHHLDLFVVTSHRIIKVEQVAFFHRSVGSFRLERLQDLNIEINGFLPTLLNFGSVEAQTAGGSEEEFRSYNLPDPRGLKAQILAAADTRPTKTV